MPSTLRSGTRLDESPDPLRNQGSNPEVARNRLPAVPEENAQITEHVTTDAETDLSADDEDEVPKGTPGRNRESGIPTPPRAGDATTLELILRQIEALTDRQKSLEGLVRRKEGRHSMVEDTDTGSTQSRGKASHRPRAGRNLRRDLPPHITGEVRSLEDSGGRQSPASLVPRMESSYLRKPTRGASGLLEDSRDEPRTPTAQTWEGDRDELNGFIMNHQTIFKLTPSKFRTDEKKIGFMITSMRKTAQTWVSAYELLPEEDKPPFMFNYALFIQELRDSFGETDETNIIATKLENLEMSTGPQGFEEYWTEFQSYVQRLRYNDSVNMRLFRKGLPPYIKDKLTYLQQEPATLNELRKAAQNINNRHLERQAERKREQARALANQTLGGAQKGVSSWSARDLQKTGGAKPTGAEARSSGPRPPLSDAERQRRQDNRLCFVCGDKEHSARNCPKATKVVAERIRAAALMEEVNEEATLTDYEYVEDDTSDSGNE